MIELKRSLAMLTASGLAGQIILADDPPASKSDTMPPNLVIILADDLGYGDLGIQGATDVQTPHIDALFRGGITFHQAYVAYPACGPSRASLMTGRHHMRMGFPCNPDHIIPTHPGELLGLPHDEITLAEELKKRGYATGMFGKWHLGFQAACHPTQKGFDEFYGFLGSLYRYFDMGNMPMPYSMQRGTEQAVEKEYLTDAFTRESIDFIERHRNQPFLLYLSHLAVHTPLMYDTDPGDADIPLNGTDDVTANRRMMVNMIKGLDRSVGAVMQALKEANLEEQTFVVFLSDNGGPRTGGAYNNRPLRDYKGSLYEGGIRVPMAAYWPGRIPASAHYDHPVQAMDLFATALALAGGVLPKDRTYDSRDLWPVLAGEQRDALHTEPVFWDALGMQAVRDGDWKLVMRNRQVEGLYHIPSDAGEAHNLTDRQPEHARQLQNLFEAWAELLPPPRFQWVGPERYKEWADEHGEPHL